MRRRCKTGSLAETWTDAPFSALEVACNNTLAAYEARNMTGGVRLSKQKKQGIDLSIIQRRT